LLLFEQSPNALQQSFWSERVLEKLWLLGKAWHLAPQIWMKMRDQQRADRSIRSFDVFSKANSVNRCIPLIGSSRVKTKPATGGDQIDINPFQITSTTCWPARTE
jgi:hypothetical protein